MRKAIITASVLLTLIGCIHIGFSFVEFEEFTENTLWFVSGGIVFIVTGLFNGFIVSNRLLKLEKVVFLKIVNLILVVFLILLVMQLPMVPGFIGLACSVFLLLFNHCT